MKPLLQVLSYGRPLVVDDAVADGVSFSPIRHDALVTDDAFLFGTKAKNGGSGLWVGFIGRELNANARQFFKREPQHKVLSLGVDERPLPRCREPGASNLKLSILVINLPEAC